MRRVHVMRFTVGLIATFAWLASLLVFQALVLGWFRNTPVTVSMGLWIIGAVLWSLVGGMLPAFLLSDRCFSAEEELSVLLTALGPLLWLAFTFGVHLLDNVVLKTDILQSTNIPIGALTPSVGMFGGGYILWVVYRTRLTPKVLRVA